MQVFELHFNPKAKEEEIYDSFLFEPENILERRLGSLYIVGHLARALPQNFKFLEKLSSQIKKKYYLLSAHSPESALRESLKVANEFLADEVQKGNVSWLGNLNLAVCSLKDCIFNFTLVGNLKVLLLRSGKIIDVGKNLELQEMEPYPLKIFGNIVSGKLSERDKILVLTKDIFDFFSSPVRPSVSYGAEQNLIQEIAKLELIEEKELKTLLKSREKLFAEISGIFLLTDLSEKMAVKEKIAFEKIVPTFSIWQIFSPISKFKISRLFKFPRLPRLEFPKLKSPFEKIRPERIKEIPKIRISSNLKRNLVLVLILILLLFVGSFFAKLEKGEELKQAQSVLEEVQSKIFQAESALILKDKKGAKLLFQEAWQEILPQTEAGSPLEKGALELKEEIENQLLILNRVEKITNPELLFDFKELNFIPQKMINFQGKLCFFSPVSVNLYQFNVEEKKGDFLKTDQKFNLASSLREEIILFYSKPDKLFSLEDKKLSGEIGLKAPYPDFYFNSFSTYKSNIYFLHAKKGEILKFSFREDGGELLGNLWLSSATKKPIGAESLAVDGSVWILNENNSIDRYHAGNWQETLELNIFPLPKNFSKILTLSGLSYLYVLEPAQNRIIVLNKSGEIWRQFQSESFDNLKDFSVSENGKTIYLLNGLKVYKVEL